MRSMGRPVALGDLIRIFRISFRLRPIYVSVANDEPEIGFEVELIGTHSSMGEHVRGGCTHCRRVLLLLLEVADHILPGAHDRSRSGGSPCERFVRYTSTGNPEVALSMTIIRPATLEDVARDRVLLLSGDIRTALLALGCEEVPFSDVLPPTLIGNCGGIGSGCEAA